MRLLSISVALAAATGVCAQSSNTIKTATDFGALVTSGSAKSFRSIAKDTTVTRGATAYASVGRRWLSSYARSQIFPARSFTLGNGVSVHESGNANGTATSSDISVGSSDSAPKATSPAFGVHGTSLNVPLAKGKKAKVTIHWSSFSSSKSAATASVDVDGDNKADFTAKQSDRSLRKTIDVTAGDNGIQIAISTSGKASQKGRGRVSYSTKLSVYVNTGDSGGDCTFTAFGKECGGKLTGSARNWGKGAWVTLEATGAAKSSAGLLVVGTKLTTPIKLPGSNCTLDADPKAVSSFRIDDKGEGSRAIFVGDRSSANIDMQIVTVSIGSKGVSLDSTNGLNLTCK